MYYSTSHSFHKKDYTVSIISVKNLIKKYKKAKENAVDDITFEVQEGEFFALLGPNGAGKTTTISILTTTLSKTSGEVYINGYEIEKEASKVRQSIGIIFQKPSIDLNLTAEENIRFHSILYGLYDFAPSFRLMSKEYQDKVIELAEIIGIKEQLFQPLKTYSGGMRRKLEIIRSLMHSPKILFLDEPTVGLDPESRLNLWNYILKMRKNTGITIFLTTHYLDEAEGVDRVCIINNGKISALGTPNELKKILAYKHVRITFVDNTKGAKELESMNLQYNVKNEYIEVIVNDFEQIKFLINQLKTPIKEFDIRKPSLEEAYINIIKEDLIN